MVNKFFLIILITFSFNAFGQSTNQKLLNQATSYIKSKDYELAENLLKEIIDGSDDSLILATCFNNQGYIAMKNEDLARAIDLMNMALITFPRMNLDTITLITHYNLGIIYKDLGEFQQVYDTLFLVVYLDNLKYGHFE